MREGMTGGPYQEGERAYPEDTESYSGTRSWKLSISRREQCLMIDTADYHPGLLYLTKDDLEEILKKLMADSS